MIIVGGRAWIFPCLQQVQK